MVKSNRSSSFFFRHARPPLNDSRFSLLTLLHDSLLSYEGVPLHTLTIILCLCDKKYRAISSRSFSHSPTQVPPAVRWCSQMWTPHFQVCKLSQRLSQCLAVTICPTSRKGPLASLSLCASLLLTQSLSVPGFSSSTMRPGLHTTSKCRSPPVFCWHGAESSCQTIRDIRPWDPLSLQRACRPKLPGRANQRELCSCASAGRLCTISNIYILGCSRSVAKKTFVFNCQSRHRFLARRQWLPTQETERPTKISESQEVSRSCR